MPSNASHNYPIGSEDFIKGRLLQDLCELHGVVQNFRKKLQVKTPKKKEKRVVADNVYHVHRHLDML